MPVLAWVLVLRALVCCRWRCRFWSRGACGVMPSFTNGLLATCPACRVSSESGRYWAHPRNQAEKLRAARCSSVVRCHKPTAPKQPTWHEDSQTLLNTGFSLPRQWRTWGFHHSFSQTEMVRICRIYSEALSSKKPLFFQGKRGTVTGHWEKANKELHESLQNPLTTKIF